MVPSSKLPAKDDSLLDTIRVPRQLNQLKERLPKPNYKRKMSEQSRMVGNQIVTGEYSNPATPKNQVDLKSKNLRPMSGRNDDKLLYP